MANSKINERQSITDSAKSLKKYGSTCNHNKRVEHFITHEIQKTDTLQGIALKYNSTTEQIRRVNRLFASDSLFLRDSLKIPVTKEVANSFDSGTHSNSGSTSETITSPVSSISLSDDEEKSVNDYLVRIDSFIATTRAQVKHVQENSDFIDPTDPTIPRRKHNRSNARSTHQTHNNIASHSNDVFATPHPVVLNQGRKVRSSLQRLEKEQDELFEL